MRALNPLKNALVAAALGTGVAVTAFGSASAVDRQPCVGCTTPPPHPHPHHPPVVNNNTASASQSLKNTLMMLNAGPAAAAVGDGCTVVTGINIGAGFNGVGATISLSDVNRPFFLLCNNYRQLEQVDPCIAMIAKANGAPEEGMPGNPALARALYSPAGQERFASVCGIYKVQRLPGAPTPKG